MNRVNNIVGQINGVSTSSSSLKQEHTSAAPSGPV
jgi:hypothetical protein